jgi:hypothetical protein
VDFTNLIDNMALNTNATTSWRAKWFSTMLQETLHNALVAEKICAVDRSDSKYIWNPYGSAATVTQQAIAGTYSVATYTSTDDTLTVTEEFVWSEHIYDYESVSQNGDIMKSRQTEAMASMATAIDKFVLNNLCEDGTGTYTTPAGGFTTGSNIQQILGDLCGKVAGYADTYRGLYLVVENTDVTGFMQSGMASGFSFADSWLKNGWMTSYAGVDIYVVRSGTFVSATLGTTAVTNAGHRVFGVKGVSTYATPRTILWEEKPVSGKTGRELMAVAYCGFKAWFQKLALTVDITIA